MAGDIVMRLRDMALRLADGNEDVALTDLDALEEAAALIEGLRFANAKWEAAGFMYRGTLAPPEPPAPDVITMQHDVAPSTPR